MTSIAGSSMQANYVIHDDEVLEPALPRSTNAVAFEVELPPLKPQKKRKKWRRARSVDVFIEKDKEIASFQGFHCPVWKTVVYYLLGVVTCGFSLLLARWSPKVHIFLSMSKCHLRDATFVRITLMDGRVDLEPVTQVVLGTPPGGTTGEELDADVEEGREVLLEWQSAQKHRLLEYRCNRYFFVETIDTFVPVPAIPKGFNDQLQKSATQLAVVGSPLQLEEPDWDVADREMRYGSNEMAIPVKSIPMLIFQEMWHPFYVFQYCSIIIWIAGDQYYSYSICIFVITWFSIISSAVETHNNAKRLAGIARFTSEVDVMRNGEFVQLPSSQLVPGDIVVVDMGPLPCDLVLLRGECIVDENMLTGESVPVRKVAYNSVADAVSYNPDKSSHCTLYGGTTVAQARAARGQKPLGMVCRTRFYSAKGQLLRSILFPREHEQSFISDSLKFIVFMLLVCVALYIWAAVVLHSVGATSVRIVIRFFDMVTIAVPPALPACLTIATVFSIGRLRKKGVFVTGPDRIAMAGQLDVICFDKTGTLTEQGLDLQGIVPIEGGRILPMVASVLQLPQVLQELLASCHGLASMGQALVGDPLDQKLFQATHWELVDEHTHDGDPSIDDGDDTSTIEQYHHVHTFVRPPGSQQAFTIIKRFEFQAALQRNVVVIKAPNQSVAVFAKGSPEMIRTLVQPETIPADFDSVLQQYTREGLRVLALAQGDASLVPEDILLHWTQVELESSVPLSLVGLAVMVNPLRPDSAEVVKKLQDASIRTVMVTGDHLRTAVSIAHHCHIMPDARPICLVDGSELHSNEPPFEISVLHPDGSVSEGYSKAAAAKNVVSGEFECAVTGKGFTRLLETLDAELMPAVLQCTSVFARMSPDNKRDLVELLGSGIDAIEHCPHLGLHVAFCGDGANDCGALKAAHVGVSLCEAEASVAAPMTSKNQTIASMITVVAEGRCTLMATFQIFQFIIGYALVQAFETNLMYTYALNVGNYQYLIQDLFFTTVLAALMGYTEPRNKLSKQKPLNRVMSMPLLVSTVAQLVVVIAFQLISLAALSQQPDYEPTKGSHDLKDTKAPENTTTYLIALAQFIVLALVFNKGRPHRSPIWTNTLLTLSIIAQVLFVFYSLYVSSPFNEDVQELVDKNGVVDNHFRDVLLVIMLANGLVAFLVEYAASGFVRFLKWMRPPKPAVLRLAVPAAAA